MKRQNKHPANEHAGPPASSWWRQDGLLGFLLVAVTFLAYQPVWHAGFIWDDDTFLTDNPVIKSADGLYRMWFTASTPDYFPVTSSLLWLEWRIWGSHPLGYHLINVLLHAASAVLLWRVLQRLKIPGALLAAALFALHPVNVESVAWITERKNTLAMFFYAGTLLCWLKFEDNGRGRWYGLALAGFALGLLSKTAVAPLPVVLLGIAWWRRGRVGWKDVGRAIPFFVIAAVLALVTVWFQYHKAINHEVVRTDGFWSRLAGAGWAVWFYLYKAVLPLNLSFVYPRWQIDARNVLSYIPVVLLAAALVFCWRKSRALFFGLAYFVVMLLPILGFLNIYFMRYSLVADHWEYFAIIGPIALVAAILRKPVVGAALLLALGALTWKQCGMYANAETLWETTLQLNPSAWIAHNNLGYDLLYKEGQTDKAIIHFQKALEIDSNNAEAHNNLGNAFWRQGRKSDAIFQYEKALEIRPDYPQAHNDLGLAFFLLGRMDEAIAQYQKALASQPDYANAHYNLGNLFSRQGRTDEAIAQYEKALETNPDFAEAHMNLGGIFDQQGRMDEAIAQYQKALAIQPDFAEAQYDFGNILARKGRMDEAIAHYEKALQIKPDYAEAQYNLGGSYFQLGRLNEAIAQYQKVLEIKPDHAEARNNIGLCFFLLGRMDEAIAQYQKALAIQPDYADAQRNLAWVLATCPQAALRNGSKAVELAERANHLTGGGSPFFLCTLAAAYAEAGRFSEAVETAQRALRLAGAQANTTLAGQLQEQLKLYQAGMKFHGTAQTH